MKNNFKILFFCPSLSFGGLEMQMVNKCKESIDAGYSAMLVTIKNSPMEEYANKLSVPCKFLNVWIDYVDIINSYKLGSIMADFDADVCIVGLSRHLSISLMARKLKSRKTAIIFMQQMQSGVRKIDYFHNNIYNNLDSAIVPAKFMKTQLLENTVIDPSKIKVIPYGIDTRKFNPNNFNKFISKQKFGLQQDKFVIGMAARFDEIKDQMTLVKAFHKAEFTDAILLLAGQGNIDYKQKVVDEINYLNIKNKVVFVDFTLNFAELLHAMDIFILPSQTETFSLALIQAMAAGLPVIATNEGGSPEAVHHLENGLLFKARNVDELSDLLKQIANDKALREKIASQALRDANLYYNKDNQNAKFFNVCINSFENRSRTISKYHITH